MAASNYTIQQGATWALNVMWQRSSLTSVAITAVTQSVQALVTAAAHGLPTARWPVYVRGVKGMTKLNHTADDLDPSSGLEYYAEKVDANSLKLDVDTVDFSAYTSGGELVYRPPVDLTGYTARMHLRESKDAAATLLELSSAAPTAGGSSITLGGTEGTIDLVLGADDTTAATWTEAYYDLELEAADGKVTRVIEGKFTLSTEVTHD